MSEIGDWARLNVSAAARDALSLIGETLREDQYRTDMLAYQQIDGGRLTPEMALAFWHRKNALYTLQRRLMQKERQGVSSAQRLADASENSNG